MLHETAPHHVALVAQAIAPNAIRQEQQPSVLDAAGREHEPAGAHSQRPARRPRRPHLRDGASRRVGLKLDGGGVETEENVASLPDFLQAHFGEHPSLPELIDVGGQGAGRKRKGKSVGAGPIDPTVDVGT